VAAQRAVTVPLWLGDGGDAYRSVAGAATAPVGDIVGSDVGTAPALGDAGAAARDGGHAMDGIIADTRAGVAAIAPSTDTPAGKAQLSDRVSSHLLARRDGTIKYTMPTAPLLVSVDPRRGR
jgi:hypothetical protein